MFSGALKPWHIIVLVIVILVLFGGKKLPGAARSLGQSLRILKSETKKLREDDKTETSDSSDEKADVKHAREPIQPKTIDGEVSKDTKTDKTHEQA